MKSRLSHLILTIYISVTFTDRDCYVINREKGGKFSAKSGYQCYFPLLKNIKAEIFSCYQAEKRPKAYEKPESV